MCYYRLYIFLGCGHTTFSARPVRPCAAVRSKRKSTSQQQRPSTAQEASPKVHPQGPQSASTIADVHTTDAPTFHANHDAPTPTSPQPHTESANNPQDPVASRRTPEADAATHQECDNLSTHPFQTLNIHTSCARCLRRRAERMQQHEERRSTVRFEDWRWKVKYLSPTPEEARYSAEWGNVGSAVGSWVKDLKGKRDEILGTLREQVVDGKGRRDSTRDGGDFGWAGSVHTDGKGEGKRGEGDDRV